MPTDNHDLGKDTLGGTKPSTEREEETPGYELTDVNIGGVIVFLAGLCGFLVIFFVFCFVMGKAINTTFLKDDGPADKWHSPAAPVSASADGRLRENLASNPAMEQRELQQMTNAFPTPRLETDDGNQDLADLHAREDLLLENYSSDNGTTRIPIERAMQLVAQRGLPVVSGQGAPQMMAGDAGTSMTPPLTDGFARTGYELDVMEAREQRLNYEREATPNTHAQLQPVR